MAGKKLSSLLAKPIEDTLMGYQKTKNSRDKKKAVQVKMAKKDYDKMRYMKKRKDKIGLLAAAIKESDRKIKKGEIEVEAQLEKIVEEKKKKEKMENKIKNEKKMKAQKK